MPDFLQAMTLLTALPPTWGPQIIQQSMAGGVVMGITMADTKAHIGRYWDAEQACWGTGKQPKVNKISNVQRFPNKGQPFHQQAHPNAARAPSTMGSTFRKG